MRFNRSSGILLHPTSLPGEFGIGNFGASSYHFVDWLSVAGQSFWQMLPIGPIGVGNSPYMSTSAFAGNPFLIDLNELVALDLLEKKDIILTTNTSPNQIDYEKVTSFYLDKIEKAGRNFLSNSNDDLKNDYNAFCQKEKYWLDDYALFQALTMQNPNIDWTMWNSDVKMLKQKVIAELEKELAEQILIQKFAQWIFDRQWKRLKAYANSKGIKLIGDMPIFVAHHSTDVWKNQELFYLDSAGNPTVVAGVPPDYFSKTGQRWGNPLYNWQAIKEKKYQWWYERFKRLFSLFDIIRIDHFRGFESYWEIPANENNAIKGNWKMGPGVDFFKSVNRKLGDLPIIAEDLGIITPEVNNLREKVNYPGMKVLQFAFSGSADNAYLPHNYIHNCVVYTGTHDNDTTRGWYEKATEHERDFVRRYCKTNGHEINWDLIKLASNSVADISIIPFQDIMGLGSEARMNIPSTLEGNWEWRFSWEQVGPDPANRLYELTALYGRCKADKLNLL